MQQRPSRRCLVHRDFRPTRSRISCAPLVRTLFQLYLTGDHSIRSLHQEMRRLGLTTRRGKLISRRNIEQILQNPFYCGLTRNGRSGEVFQGKHEPLISSRQFQRVADIKAGRYTKKNTRHNHMFRRLFFCSNCGELMSPWGTSNDPKLELLRRFGG
ncbi:recombinase family protein [Salipiger pentaromativorans]|uniref:recombinase family protein n=1 Tax=Salipiger pentaromativorans TaxID=2943193 RepID=UPI003B84B74D